VPGKAELIYKSKLILNSGLVEESVIWKVPTSKYFPEGVKYRLLLVDPVWKKILVLFDNHSPKGHHRHDSNGKEHNYRFISVKLLIEDFLELRAIAEKNNENNEN
jgi:hypothetical protein